MKRINETIVTALLAVALFAGYSLAPAQDEHEHEGEAHADEVVLTEEAVRLSGIAIERAGRRALADTVTVPARVGYDAEAMAHIGTQVQGRVREIAVRLGDRVGEGDLLLVIDSPELGRAQSAYLEADAALDAARIGAEAAKTMSEVAGTAYERAEKLRESNGISITEFLERKGALLQAEAAVRMAEADAKVAESARLAAENQLHIYGISQDQVRELLETGEISTRYEVRSPIAGRVIEREVTPGEVVHSDDEALMVVANMDELWVTADVPERSIGRVAEGGPASVTVGFLGGMTFEGTVSYIAPQLDPRTRTASVRIVVPASAPAAGIGEDAAAGRILKPGMFGEAELTLDPPPGQSGLLTVVVRHEAVLTVEGGPAVFVPVHGEPNTFAKRAVDVGDRIGRYRPVLSGLEEGEEYVATNPFILKAELGKAGAAHEH